MQGVLCFSMDLYFRGRGTSKQERTKVKSLLLLTPVSFESSPIGEQSVCFLCYILHHLWLLKWPLPLQKADTMASSSLWMEPSFQWTGEWHTPHAMPQNCQHHFQGPFSPFCPFLYLIFYCFIFSLCVSSPISSPLSKRLRGGTGTGALAAQLSEMAAEEKTFSLWASTSVCTP